jgi:hypothetical protein
VVSHVSAQGGLLPFQVLVAHRAPSDVAT